MKIYVCIIIFLFFLSSCFKSAVISGREAQFKAEPYCSSHPITDVHAEITIYDTIYQHLPHFLIKTPFATYFISKESGGCTSMMDKEGNDWIQNTRTGNNPPFNSADSDFRGMPNLVFKGEDDGVGHPSGLNKCKTIRVAHNKILVKSLSGKWEFSWTFFADHAILEVEKTDPERNYWFLYEGPVAGKFDPQTHYWATDTEGIRRDKPINGGKAALGNWQWVCIGDENVNRCLFISMAKKDQVKDYFGYMGNLKNAGLNSPDGMTVFGFGRSGTTPLLMDKNIFIFGLYEENLEKNNSFLNFKAFINQLIADYNQFER